MPKNKSAYNRYRIIDKCLNNRLKPFPTKEYLAQRCSELLHIDVSNSTIEKDIAFMKETEPRGLGAPIVYSKINKGYVYSEKGFSISELSLADDEWEALNFASQLLYQYKDVPIFSSFKSAIERISFRFSLGFEPADPILNKSVEFEQAVETKGMEWIQGIYQAIQNRYLIEFSYHNIYKMEKKFYQVCPYLLKEYRNRWYIIGWNENKGKFMTFGLDRLSDLSIIEIKQKLRADFQSEAFFEHATGIMKAADKPTNIELIIKSPISELVMLEPLHLSQKLLKQDKDYIRVKLKVYVNEEFYLRLLSLGTSCTVVKPLFLRTKIKELIELMRTNYQ